MPRSRLEWNKTTRDAVLFVGGLLGVGYETVFEQVDRPGLLVLFGGMMGLPVFLHRDVKEKDDDPSVGPQPTKSGPPVDPGQASTS